jgi:bifunctional DNA-binding transcriptional regulator/antitoxin component of YhaV-PrlF toxin-antitoxin module
MKLQKQKAYKYKDKIHYKYTIVIPDSVVEGLGWKESQELECNAEKSSLKIFSKDKVILRKSKKQVPNYADFQKSVESVLKRFPEGLIWSEIKKKMNFPQSRPNNRWVRQLEEDIGLTRVKTSKHTIWKIENRTIYTIGYEGVKIEEFIEKLLEDGIEQLVDVREIAFSRKNGFSKSKLKEGLKQKGIYYVHNQKLGSPKNIRNELFATKDYKKFFREYANHVKGKDIQEEITNLEGFSKVRKTAIMCFEKDVDTCHRKTLSSELKKRGWRIIHIK